jgi:predicted DNA binding protein
MAIRIDINETFDTEGNLIHSETVEVEIPDNPMEAVVASLTEEQRALLLNALNQ